MSKPLTPTQIKAVVDKMYVEASTTWNARVHAAQEAVGKEVKDAEAALAKKRLDYFNAGKFTKADLLIFKMFLTGATLTKRERAEHEKSIFFNKDKPAKKKEFPPMHVRVSANMDRWERRNFDPNHPVERMIADLKFKLTMASAENYEQFMADFRKELNVALASVK